MIVVIIVVVAADNLDELRQIYAQEAERFRQQIEDAHSQMFEAACDCGWKDWYQTPGRAKMGLSAHRQRRKCDAKTSQQAGILA